MSSLAPSEQLHFEIYEANKRKYPDRSRTRHSLPSEPEMGQTTLFETLNGARARRGAKHWVDGPNEEAIIEAFEHIRFQEGDHPLQARSSYPRGFKLRAIQYYRYTWRKDKNDLDSPVTVYYATRKLVSPPPFFLNGLAMKVRYYQLEKALEYHTTNNDVHTLRWKSVSTSYSVFIELLESVSHITGLLVMQKRFIESFTLQKPFKQRLSLQNGFILILSFQILGRFLLSDITNMDQTPLGFEFGSSERTYDHTGNKTALLKGGKGGWENWQATLQNLVSADGVPRCKPLLIFKGAEGVGPSTRRAEARKYHKGVDVIFNPKGYCNTEELLN
ncbi:uncharacterized protein EAF02_002662 [Botrytis sinoallii]|uniref:uncharacterized protein n=1 Tax=Botrytis sinoallii TaxID=1463999 RepID=UPI001901B483|nr:uncharacterized protein EAF02_002662 [Botrytis sinoallii]KAF7888121.1 hypothetical protein EAF02_002662 [Botrytis sinoallii]